MPPKRTPGAAAAALKTAKRQVQRLAHQRDKKSLALYYLKKRHSILRRKVDQIHSIISTATIEDERNRQDGCDPSTR